MKEPGPVLWTNSGGTSDACGCCIVVCLSCLGSWSIVPVLCFWLLNYNSLEIVSILCVQLLVIWFIGLLLESDAKKWKQKWPSLGSREGNEAMHSWFGLVVGWLCNYLQRQDGRSSHKEKSWLKWQREWVRRKGVGLKSSLSILHRIEWHFRSASWKPRKARNVRSPLHVKRFVPARKETFVIPNGDT